MKPGTGFALFCLLFHCLGGGRAEAGPRACVSAWLAGPTAAADLEKLVRDEWPAEIPVALHFKPGPQGFRECVSGDYDSVTLIAHTRVGLSGKPVLIYEQEIGGKLGHFPIDSRYFERLRPSAAIRGLNLVACEGDRAIAASSGLQELIERAGWKVRVQPWDTAQSREKGKPKRARLGGLTSLFIAEGAQPDEDLADGRTVRCLADTREMGSEPRCLWGRIGLVRKLWEPPPRGIYWVEVRKGEAGLELVAAERLEQDEQGRLQRLGRIDSPRFRVTEIQ